MNMERNLMHLNCMMLQIPFYAKIFRRSDASGPPSLNNKQAMFHLSSVKWLF